MAVYFIRDLQTAHYEKLIGLAIEKATGVPRWALRPDVFEKPDKAA